MRILMLDNEFPPLGGGTGVVNYHLLQELASYPDVAVDLVTSSRTRDRFERERFSERITIYKVPVDNRNIHHSTNRELLRYTWRAFGHSRALLRQHRYDLSFAFAGVPAGAISYALKTLSGLPYLVSLQGPDVPGFEARYNYLYPFLTPILRQVWGNATVVTAISREHQRLAHQTMPHLDIPIVYNGVDTRSFYPAPVPHDRAEVRLVCVARLIERKGQHHLLRSLAELRRTCDRPVRLNLVGTGDAEATLRGLAVELGVDDVVTFSGFVARDEMPAVYRQSDLFVLPSQSEGMSIALLEAMASGLPVVVTAAGGTSELVQPGVNGMVVPWADVEALTRALHGVTADQALRSRMGAASRARVAAFSWETITSQYLQLCEHVAASAFLPWPAGAVAS